MGQEEGVQSMGGLQSDMNPWKRKEVIGDATLYLGDCLDFLRACSDNEFEVAIVDPPYAVGASDGSFGRGGSRSMAYWSGGETYRKDLAHYANASSVPDDEYFKHLFRVSRHQIIWGANYYPQYLTHSGWIVWDKKKKDGLLSQAELAFQSFDKRVMIFEHEWEGFRKGVGSFEDGATQTIHPNQKPVRLYEWCISKFCDGFTTVLDTHMGSGSLAVATNSMGMKITAIELDETYFQKACERITNAYRQSRLFA